MEYWQEKFLHALKALENQMVHWELTETNDGEELRMVVPTNLLVGIKPIVLIDHDESTFNANDGRSNIWIKDDHIPLRKKTRGKGIMVSDFLTPRKQLQVPEGQSLNPNPGYGTQQDGPKPLDSHLASCSIEYGGDTWWDGDQLVDQVLQLAIPIFEIAFPDCQGLLLFDNAISYYVYTKDALRASAMNLGPGGGQALLWPRINPLTSAIQSMVMPDSSPKGLQIVL